MLGWFNNCLEKLIVSKYSTKTWHSIKTEAGCQVIDGGFAKLTAYSDESTAELVKAASRVLQMETKAVLKLFGAFFVNYIKDQGYANLLSCQGRSLKEMLSNINHMHAHVQCTSPTPLMLPQFWVEDSAEEDGSLILHYHSKRGNFMAPFVEGMITEIAATHFDVEVDLIPMQKQGRNGSDLSSWSISAVDLEEQWKLTSMEDPNLQQTTNTSMEIQNTPLSGGGSIRKCPFSGMAATATTPQTAPSTPSTVSVMDSVEPSEMDSSVSSTSGSKKIGLSGAVTDKLFPYHVMINQNFQIVQVGKDLPSALFVPEEELVGQSVGSVLSFKQPSGMDWNWRCMSLLEDQSFEIEPASLPQHQKENAEPSLCFKTTLVLMSRSPAMVMLILTPHAQTLEELKDMNLTINDVPLHGGYRDALLVSEHLSSQMNSALKVEKLSRHLEREKGLLESLLPAHAAEGLRKGKMVKPMLHKNVTFFFSDIVGFTSICNELYPWQVVEMLNTLYCVMDYLAVQFNLFKVETIGDAYVCCSGLPYEDPDHAKNVANFAVAVNHCAKQVLSPFDNKPIQLRIGVHTGQSASGIVGVTNPRYCVFGDTVNATARHESSGMPGRVHCSSTTHAELVGNCRDSFSLAERGFVEMKGLGQRKTFWLEGSERNDAINQSALMRLEKEVKDLLVKADFKSVGCTSSEEIKGPTLPPHKKQQFHLPSKNSVVRNSNPSMHDVKTIGSIMKSIKKGEGLPAKNFSWGPPPKKQLHPRSVSLGSKPVKRTDNSLSRIVESLDPVKRISDPDIFEFEPLDGDEGKGVAAKGPMTPLTASERPTRSVSPYLQRRKTANATMMSRLQASFKKDFLDETIAVESADVPLPDAGLNKHAPPSPWGPAPQKKMQGRSISLGSKPTRRVNNSLSRIVERQGPVKRSSDPDIMEFEELDVDLGKGLAARSPMTPQTASATRSLSPYMKRRKTATAVMMGRLQTSLANECLTDFSATSSTEPSDVPQLGSFPDSEMSQQGRSSISLRDKRDCRMVNTRRTEDLPPLTRFPIGETGKTF